MARCLAIVTELGVADLVASEPMTAEQIATRTSAHPGALYRVLRMLASMGIFSEDESGGFHPNEASRHLQQDTEGSLRELLRLPWQDLMWQTYAALPHTIMTGEPAFDHAHGQAFFDYLAAHPEANAQFDRSMALISGPEEASVADALELGGNELVVDVGGGQGGLLAAVLRRYPDTRAVLYDQSQVIAEPAYLDDPALLKRCKLVAGDFFASVPQHGDAYLLKRILHDWGDAEAVLLLRRCREAMPAGSRVLVIEAVIKPGNKPDPNKAQDVGMMMLTPGRERNAEEYRLLFEQADLRLGGIIPTAEPSRLSVIIGHRAD